ncbi:hypothetical protein MC378_02195 [Polaribacter sp. MSW13]|uniref:Uncharacterized protein n=1 Tax=Polaribacter marinus TaxID=2916838 RepID=A0A9X1VKR9_9FLAO|nr:hypothetical protein [Polaribacter marinus]MCI2227961.1 hypothetical protein [Polaribacter marinus]
MKTYSIENSEESILRPNSEFERRIILQYYLDNDIAINSIEREILLKTNVSEPESIGIIGCLLKDNNYLNIIRLAIGAKNRSNKKLAEVATSLFNSEQLEKADSYYFFDVDTDELSEIENVVTREYIPLYL